MIFYIYIFWNIERIVSLVSEASSRVVRYTYMSSKPSGNLFVLHNKINQQCVKIVVLSLAVVYKR